MMARGGTRPLIILVRARRGRLRRRDRETERAATRASVQTIRTKCNNPHAYRDDLPVRDSPQGGESSRCLAHGQNLYARAY